MIREVVIYVTTDHFNSLLFDLPLISSSTFKKFNMLKEALTLMQVCLQKTYDISGGRNEVYPHNKIHNFHQISLSHVISTDESKNITLSGKIKCQNEKYFITL